MRLSIAASLLILAAVSLPPQTIAPQKGQRLEELTWQEAERVLTPETVVVIPLGAGSKEHGPHLKLRNDLTMAEYLTRRVIDSTAVVVAPTLTYHYYPAFLEYPGSTSLTLKTAQAMTTEVVSTLAPYGPRRFYVLNTGISTLQALKPAAEALAADGILLRYTDLEARLAATKKTLMEQPGGTHADEIETSMMLYIDPASVDMAKAVRDYTATPTSGRLTRQPGRQGVYSATGISGDPRFATEAKGRALVEALVSGIVDDIAQLRAAPLPSRSTAPSASAAAGAGRPAVVASQDEPDERTCTPGDVREIRNIGFMFASAWSQKDSKRLAELWSAQGNIIHPDGAVETGAVIIEQNRHRLFLTPEYRGSHHLLQLNLLRCLSTEIAVADGKWELTDVVDAANKPVPKREGQVTLVVKRIGARWYIEAYRYTVK
jgi:creatinine amidohydrolase